MRTPVDTLDASMSPKMVLGLMERKGVYQLPVSDGRHFLGMISKIELEGAAPEFEEVRQLVKDEFPHLHSDHTLDIALHRMGSNRMHELPVVSRRDVHRLEGLVSLDDVLRLYGLDQYGREKR